jgi:hypothetical protein
MALKFWSSCRAQRYRPTLEHFRNTYRLLSGVEGAFFLRKKALSIMLSDYTNSENAICTRLRLCCECAGKKNGHLCDGISRRGDCSTILLSNSTFYWVFLN